MVRDAWAGFVGRLLLELCLIASATAAALLVRDNFAYSPDRLLALLPYLSLTLALAIPVWLALGLHRTIWRFSAMGDYLRVLMAVAIAVLAATAVGFMINRLDGVARSIPLLQALLMGFALVGVRVIARLRQQAAETQLRARIRRHGGS